MADGEKGEVDWRRKIKYSVAEYLEVVEAVKTVDDRLWGGGVINGGGIGVGPEGHIWAVMCEKVAFVLGNGGWFDDEVEGGSYGEDGGQNEVQVEDAKQEVSSETPTEDSGAGNKRKRKDTSKSTRQDDEETPPPTKTKSNPTRRNPSRAKRP
jgi:hypothetical protein